MKVSLSAVLIGMLPMCGWAQEASSREGLTKEQIAAKMSESQDAALKFKPSPAAKKEALPEQGLLERCAVLSFGGMSTLVPKGSVLRVPPSLAARMQLEAGNKMVHWTEFLNANRGWLRALEVTQAQAEGKDPFSEEMAKNISSGSSVTVATLKGYPVSVLPPKPATTNPPSPAKR